MSTIRLMNGSTYQISTKLKFVPIFSIAMVIITLWFSKFRITAVRCRRAIYDVALLVGQLPHSDVNLLQSQAKSLSFRADLK